MDLALNSTKSMECLKGYSVKPCFVLSRGVRWKLPTFATHYASYLFIYFSFPVPDAPFPVARRSLQTPRPRRRRLPVWCSPTRRPGPRPRRRRLPWSISTPPCRGPRPWPRRRRRPAWSSPCGGPSTASTMTRRWPSGASTTIASVAWRGGTGVAPAPPAGAPT
jgi:hypothetical protein